MVMKVGDLQAEDVAKAAFCLVVHYCYFVVDLYSKAGCLLTSVVVLF